EGADSGGDGFGLGEQPDGDLGDDAESALAADEDTGEVVAGRGFPGAAGRAEGLAAGRDDLEAEDLFAPGGVADGVWAGGSGGGHAAEGGICSGIDGEEESAGQERGVELLAGDAGLDGGGQVLRVHGEDLVHAGEVEADAALDGHDVAL